MVAFRVTILAPKYQVSPRLPFVYKLTSDRTSPALVTIRCFTFDGLISKPGSAAIARANVGSLDALCLTASA
ncbi:MAG: hypothetical protein INR62_09700 [Rhodospirillales bacterium]|nr:hypothetical protein [Acetobacter sp.]